MHAEVCGKKGIDSAALLERLCFASYAAIRFQSNVQIVADAGITAASATAPSHTIPPPPGKAASVKSVNGKPQGKKQSAHRAVCQF